MPNTYDVGDAVHLTVEFRTTLTNALVDPTALALTMKLPDGSLPAAQTWPAGTIVRTGIGQFYYDFLVTLPGRHFYSFLGTGAGAARGQDYFEVRENLVA